MNLSYVDVLQFAQVKAYVETNLKDANIESYSKVAV